MKVLTKALIKKSEENAVSSGIFSFRELMHTAGKSAAEIILKEYDCRNKNITVVCGRGNNAGDGFVIASILSDYGANVTVITPLGEPATENARYYFKNLVNVKKSDDLIKSCDILIDAIFGIGLNRELEKDVTELIDKINSLNCIRVSVDIPSGISADDGKILGTAIDADLTITFIALKPCFLLPPASDFCGKVTVADIGVKPESYNFLTLENPLFEKRRHNSHKGTFGTALLFCGCYGMAGAAILSARAALRSGAGIVKCVLADSIYPAFTSVVPEAVCVPVKQNQCGTISYENMNVEALTQKCNAILFGCGLGQSQDIYSILKKLIKISSVPIIIDADGINALCNGIDIIKNSKCPIILTPHPGEMARLCSTTVQQIESDRVATASDFSRKYGCILVLKGANTIIAEPSGEIYFNTTGNPGMSTGGSGDVLSGIIVSLLAQGMNPESAVKAAVYIHGETGDKASARKGQRAMIPSDMIEEL